MGHRHHPNSFRMPTNRGHDGSHSTAQPHNHTGRAPEMGSLPHLPDNVSRGEVRSSLQWSSGSRTHDHPSRYGMQVQQFQPDHSASSYDPFSISSASTNLHLIPQDDGGFGHFNYNEICHISDDGRSGLQDYVRGSQRGIKRKSPDNSTVCERGSTSRISGAGSSSNSAQPLPTSGYQNLSSGHVGLPYCGGGSGSGSGSVVINGEDPMRNVRSRSRLDLETNTSNCWSSYSSYNYCPTSNPSGHYGAGSLPHTNVNETNRGWSFNTLPAADGRAQISGTGTENCYPRPIVRNRNAVSSRQYHHNTPYWGAREGHSDHSERALPAYGAGPSNPRFAGRAVPASNPLQSFPESHSSRYSVQSTGGWRNYHRNGRSHTAVGRSRSVSHRADAHYRTGSEDFTVMDGSSLHVRSRSSFDQYRSLRIDVDNMTYEELLALGERIGSVNTGLSEDMISKCLIEETNSSNQNQEEEKCCICLEEYTNEEGVGMIRNCRHKYHVSCIRKWLSMKNACPICKTPALADAPNE